MRKASRNLSIGCILRTPIFNTGRQGAGDSGACPSRTRPLGISANFPDYAPGLTRSSALNTSTPLYNRAFSAP